MLILLQLSLLHRFSPWPHGKPLLGTPWLRPSGLHSDCCTLRALCFSGKLRLLQTTMVAVGTVWWKGTWILTIGSVAGGGPLQPGLWPLADPILGRPTSALSGLRLSMCWNAQASPRRAKLRLGFPGRARIAPIRKKRRSANSGIAHGWMPYGSRLRPPVAWTPYLLLHRLGPLTLHSLLRPPCPAARAAANQLLLIPRALPATGGLGGPPEVAWTDAAASRARVPSLARAAWAARFGVGDREASGPVPGAQTGQRAELYVALEVVARR